MSRSTISTFKLFEIFPNEDVARQYLEGRLWPNGPVCPDCKSDRITTRTRPGFYHCNACNFDFTVRTGTIFERSKVPLHKWVYAMYLLVTARKGISSMQLAKEIGVTQKTAWFILGRLREACGTPGDPDDKLKGVIEIDECFIGGKEANKHEHKKLKAGRGSVGKTPVLGMRERGGRTRAVTHKHRRHQEGNCTEGEMKKKRDAAPVELQISSLLGDPASMEQSEVEAAFDELGGPADIVQQTINIAESAAKTYRLSGKPIPDHLRAALNALKGSGLHTRG